MPDLESGTSTATQDNQSSGTETVETGNRSGEASQSATAQETFIPQGVDINTLPPNVRAIVDKINKDMVRGFTEKTSKLSETIKSESAKASEAYKQKAEQFDQFSSNEAFVKKWNEYVQEANKVKEEGGNTNTDPALKEMRQKLQQMEEKMQVSEVSEVTNAFAEAVDEKGEKLHPEFDTLNSLAIGTVKNGEEFSLLRACVELAQGKNTQEKLVNGYKAAKAVRDQLFELGKKAGMGRIQEKVKNSSLPPSSSTGDTLTMTEKKPKNAHEALAMAKKGVMVSR